MFASTKKIGSCQDRQFLSRVFKSREEFVKEYRELYHDMLKSQKLYHLLLTKLEQAVLEGNVSNLKRLCEIIEDINDVEETATLCNYYNNTENFLKSTNVIILACKHDKIDILRYLFNCQKILDCLSINIGKNVTSPNDKDNTGHDAFYYAIRSSNVELLDELISKWPNDYFATRSEELDEVLSKNYDELKRKNVPLSDQMEVFVASKLISIRFFSDNLTHDRIIPEDTFNNIKKRIDLVLENVALLKSEYLYEKEVDDRFLFVARFIAQNIHVLKRQLRISYIRLPWEEIEFCLVSFVYSHIKRREINFFYCAVLNKNKILVYLENFAKKLEYEKNFVENYDVVKLTDLTTLKRDEVVSRIINCNPEFVELFDDYQQIRDIHSLDKINDYLILALSVDPKEKKGQFIIIRALQVIGEYLKNTSESPKLSNVTSDLLLLSLPKNTRKIIIDLRNSLSHVHSLSRRIEIEENSNVEFFIRVQDDTKRIRSVIMDVLHNYKMKTIRALLIKIIDGQTWDEIKPLVEILKIVKLDEMNVDDFRMMEHENLEKLINGLNDNIGKKTEYETQMLDEIYEMINFIKTQSQNAKIEYIMGFASLPGLTLAIDKHRDRKSVLNLKKKAGATLKNIAPRIESHNLQKIVEVCMKIADSARSRTHGEKLASINKITCEIFHCAEFGSDNIKWIEKLRKPILEQYSFIPICKQKITDITEEKFNKLLLSRLSELKNVLGDGSVAGEFMKTLPSYKSDKKLQAVIEMLVLDIMSILGRSEQHLENNLLFLDDNFPLLIGKCLRNHLAYGNALLDVLLFDPSISIVLNAKKLISENIVKSKKKFGKLIRDDPSKLKDKYDQSLISITNQENMFAALQRGDLEDCKIHLQKGADINARTINSWTSLHFAAAGPSIEAVKFIFQHNIDIDVRNRNGQNPLHIAAAHGRTKIAEFFITKLPSLVNDKDKSKKTPLHLAAENGHERIVEILLKNKADTNSVDKTGYSPLHSAVFENHINVVKILLKKECNINANEITGGFTPLHIAAECGHLELVNFLLKNHANVDAKYGKKGTPLHAAVQKGHLEVVKALILKGADVNARVFDGFTPLVYALQFGYKDIANVLLKHNANVNICDKEYKHTPLHYAAKDGHEQMVQTLLSLNANPNLTNKEGVTPLHFAAQNGHLNIVSSLLNHGVDINIKDMDNATPLHYVAGLSRPISGLVTFATESDRVKIAEYLIQNGAEINVRTHAGLTPLHVAASKGYRHVVDLLAKNKALINCRDMAGDTPLCAAAANGHVEIIDLLLKNRAEVDTKMNAGLTPLHHAAYGGHADAVVFLIKNHAQVNARDIRGYTPLYVAIVKNHKNIVKLLIENESEINVERIINSSQFPGGSLAVNALRIAVDVGYKDIVEMLIAKGAEINSKINEEALLCSAISNNRAEIVKILVANGANVNGKHGEPLMLALLAGYKDIVDILLDNNARIDFEDSDNYPVLHVAARQGSMEIVNALLARGANVDAVTSDGLTPLCYAAAYGHEEIVASLIANKANVNVENSTGTPLHTAAARGHDRVVDVLLRNGAKVDVVDNKNRTALELAVALGHLRVVNVFLRFDPSSLNIKCQQDCYLLHIASQEKNLEMVEYLVEEGANIHATNSCGSKPVHFAAYEGNENIVRFFIEKGLSINELGVSNQTLLHYAVIKNRTEVVEYLIAHGADVNARDDNGLTSVHLATLFGFEKLIKILLQHGAVYNAVDVTSRTPLDLTKLEEVELFDQASQQSTELISNKNINVIKLFTFTKKLFVAVKYNNTREAEKCIEEGAFVNAKNAGTEITALHYAVWKGHHGIVNVLLQNKADPNVVCSERFTPIHYAARFSRLESIKILLHHGAIYNAVSRNGKTPLDFSSNKSVINLFKLLDESFQKVKDNDNLLIDDLERIDDNDTLKAVMNARSRDNKTLLTAASQSNPAMCELLERLKQGDVSAQLEEAKSLLIAGDYHQSLKIFGRLFEKRKQIFGPDNPVTLDMQLHMGKTLYKLGNYQEALNLLEEILEKQKESFGVDSLHALHTQGTIAQILYRQDRNEEALKIFQQVYEKQKELLGPDDTMTIDTQFHMVAVLEKMGKDDEALYNYMTIFRRMKKIIRDDDLAIVCVQNNMAKLLTKLGRCEDALKIYEEVLERKKRILGINHGETLRTMNDIGVVYSSQNKHREALITFEEVLNIQKKALQPNHPETLHTMINIGHVFFNQRKYVIAFKVYKECLEKCKTVFGPQHPTVIGIRKRIEVINNTYKCRGRDSSEITQHSQIDINVAAKNGDIQTVKRLLKEGIDVNDKDIDGRTPLHFAVSNGHIEIVKILLENEADVTQATNKGDTLLHMASSTGNLEIIELLFENVSRDKLNDFVNAKTTSSGSTSLHMAAKNGFFEVVKSLLKHGAAYNIANKEGKMPVDLSKHQNVVNLLKFINDLFKAAEIGKCEIINELKTMKPDDILIVTNARNNQNLGLLQVAIVNKRRNIASELINMVKNTN